MNKVILMGRLTRDPDVRYSQGENATAVARYTLAVDRRFRRDGDQTADFIGCVAFGRQAEFAEKYLRQGTKIAITGRIQTGSTIMMVRKLYQPRRTEGVYDRCRGRGAGVCGEQGGGRRAYRRLSAAGFLPAEYAGTVRSGRRRLYEYPGRH